MRAGLSGIIQRVIQRVRTSWVRLSSNLGFIPGVIVALFAALGIVLVQVDEHVNLDGVEIVFKGDGPAARTVLSVIAGSLITVAGLTFSITMVVLQLASSQFSPRLLRTFFADRLTQVVIGTYVGTFVYSILVLRAVGSFGSAGFVPRLSVTVASLLGVASVVLLILFLHHVSRMIQVSHVVARIAEDTLARMDVLYPEGYEDSTAEGDGDAELLRWRLDPAGELLPTRPGYVQQIALDELVANLAPHAERAAILVCPGDFVSGDTPVAEIWPPGAAERCRAEVLGAISVASERDLDQDLDFGVRQLADTAIKALSPGINDPTTAVTCVGYLRAILVRLTERSAPPTLRRSTDGKLTVFARHRRFDEYLESVLQINRYVDGDVWVAGEMMQALHACALAAARCNAPARARSVHAVASAVAEQAVEQATGGLDRERASHMRAALDASSREVHIERQHGS